LGFTEAERGVFRNQEMCTEGGITREESRAWSVREERESTDREENGEEADSSSTSSMNSGARSHHDSVQGMTIGEGGE